MHRGALAAAPGDAGLLIRATRRDVEIRIAAPSPEKADIELSGGVELDKGIIAKDFGTLLTICLLYFASIAAGA